MKTLKLIALIFTMNFAHAVEIQHPVLPIELTSTGYIPTIDSKGTISIKVNQKNEIVSLFTNFKINLFGVKVASVPAQTFKWAYNKPMVLLNSSEISDSVGLIPKTALTTVEIKSPTRNKDKTISYKLDVNFLKAFGEAAPKECLTFDKVNFNLIQNGNSFNLYFIHMVAGKEVGQFLVKKIKQKVKFMGDEKKLDSIEVVTKDKNILIKYSGCQRVK